MKNFNTLFQIVLLSFIGLAACVDSFISDKDAENQSEEFKSLQSRSFGDLRKLWEEQSKNLDGKNKETPRQKAAILTNLLKIASESEIEKEFQMVRNSPTKFKDMDEFSQYFIMGFAEKLIKQKDWEKLIYLLSGKSPRFIG